MYSPTSAQSRWQRRARVHIWLALSSTAVGLSVVALHSRSSPREQLSIATAYVGMLWIVASLAIGPVNLLRRKPNPVSSDLRRDLGLWGGSVGLIHVAIGLTVHMRGRMSEYFLAPAGTEAFSLRLDAFGLANHLGLASAAILAALVILSSDWSLRSLGTKRWKRWQRWNYACAGALVAHGVLYQLLEKRRFALVALFAALTVLAVALQVVGVRAFRARRSSRSQIIQSRGAADQL